ncbi:MAG: hypothetical protein K1Y36_23945 [Blastocatellia bacterium]|nr:hypothetical protein [Blastocatellia bacterium]
MNWYFIVAGTLTILVGVVHSLLGEQLIFRRMRQRGLIPTAGGPVLKEPHVRILWATWHITSVFGWGMAGMLFWLATHPAQRAALTFLEQMIAVSMAGGSVLVLAGTKGRHPGWIGLLAVAVLVWLGQAGSTK